MSTVPVYEAKARLSELLSQAERGEEITITRHGVPVARLVPPTPPAAGAAAAQRRQVAGAFRALAELRRGVKLDLPLRQAIEQGRD
ncbi:MAG: type II toxin-antitoxin system prevent-host-death family antitoxin [Rubrivivax sp.]|nr:type II toxin-antitoxin system prevent-host-death family antitoxin [Rubrivivax sp.]